MKIIHYALCSALTTLSPLAVAETMSEGQYLAVAADCSACHSASHGMPYAGGVKFDTPLGAIYSTNITPDAQTGIGQYGFKDFVRAIREGKAQDGHNLYPAMPYTSFSKLDDRQLRLLYDYFMHEVPAVRQPNRHNDIHWPMSMRWPLSVWNMMFLSDTPYVRDPLKSALWNRGAFLVQGPGHCGSCHTPRGIALQEKGLDQNDSAYLTGSDISGWFAPSLRGSQQRGLANWSQQDMVDFLQTGQNNRVMAFGPMREVIEQSTQYLTASDLNAIAVYLKSLSEDKTPSSDVGTAQRGGSAHNNGAGSALYQDNCAACHRSDGMGYRRTYPALAHNAALQDDDPSSLIFVILNGSKAPVTQKAVTGMTMPDYGWRLSDKQVAELSSFVRASWGNHASAVTPEQVRKVREKQ